MGWWCWRVNKRVTLQPTPADLNWRKGDIVDYKIYDVPFSVYPFDVPFCPFLLPFDEWQPTLMVSFVCAQPLVALPVAAGGRRPSHPIPITATTRPVWFPVDLPEGPRSPHTS